MSIQQIAIRGRSKAKQYLSASGERLILLQSAALAAVVMQVAYTYGRWNYTPSREQCAPYVKFMKFDPSTCREIPAVVVYPEPWLGMLLVGSVSTVVVGAVAATFYYSVFIRYLLAGWLAFCAVVAISGYFSYSGVGQFPGAYFIAFPATSIVAFGVSAACIASIANIFLRIHRNLSPT